MRCIRCKNELKLASVPDEELEIFYEGEIFTIVPRYGSRFDEEKLTLAICDDCIHEGLVNNLIKYDKKG